MVSRITPAQSRLIRFVISEVATDESEAKRRWQGASEFAQRYASDRHELFLVRDWTVDFTLDDDGVAWAIDTETGEAPRRASTSEDRAALFRGVHHYPELLSLLPERPPGAITCSSCEGTGIPEIVFAKPSFRHLVCACAGAGWVAQDGSS
jgi:hypothetical protein